MPPLETHPIPTIRTGLAAALAAVLAAVPLAPAGATASHHRRHHRSVHRYPAAGARRPYASTDSPTTTCRTANGTPYDPDITGGINHVGDGGPAVNFGNRLGNPCDPVYLGGPGLFGPR